jgi:Tol biopolymer transport system component
MMRRIATVLAVAALVPGGVAFAATAETSLVSVTVDGTPAAGTSGRPSISADGRFVAFASTAPNLVRGDNNGVPDVFVRDRRTGVTTRVSVSSTGAEANGPSGNPSISGDGRYVVFESQATNFVPGVPLPSANAYVRDLG